MVEIDSKNHIYILINKLEQLEGEPLNMSPSNPKTGLLFVILSIVFMKGGVVKESMVWNTLKKLRVDPGSMDRILRAGTQQYREATAPPAAPAVITSANTSASASQR
ncbi:unnamed protein product [Coregonus sp. 'balchen']|nr:unnamed protein product [Coregonus sp. 'balchen']